MAAYELGDAIARLAIGGSCGRGGRALVIFFGEAVDCWMPGAESRAWRGREKPSVSRVLGTVERECGSGDAVRGSAECERVAVLAEEM